MALETKRRNFFTPGRGLFFGPVTSVTNRTPVTDRRLRKPHETLICHPCYRCYRLQTPPPGEGSEVTRALVTLLSFFSTGFPYVPAPAAPSRSTGRPLATTGAQWSGG